MTDKPIEAVEKFILADKEFWKSLKEAKRLLDKADTARERALKACQRKNNG